MVYLGLPIKNGGSFHGELLNNQSVNLIIYDLWFAIILIYDLWFYGLWFMINLWWFTLYLLVIFHGYVE